MRTIAAGWLTALRLPSFGVSVGPVLVGAAMAWSRTGGIDWAVAMIVFAAAVLMQVLVNLQNDVGYTVRGGARDGPGWPRATLEGWLTVGAVRAAIVTVALIATALGVLLALRLGWPVLAIGAASLVAALAYMGGPRPIAYTPAGELTVLVFFGPVAVVGTDWALTGSSDLQTLLASLAVGSLAAAALAVNNHRDTAHDLRMGRRTFVGTFGESASRALFTALLFAPFVLVVVMALRGITYLLVLLLLPSALRLRQEFVRRPAGPALNPVVKRTFAFGFRFALVLAVAAAFALR